MAEDAQQFQRLLEVGVEHFDLSTRTSNCFKVQKIATLGDLAAMSAKDVLAWDNAGRKTLEEIRTLLGRVGLKLSDDASPTCNVDFKVFVRFGLDGELVTKLIAADFERKSQEGITNLRSATPEVQRALVKSVKSMRLSNRATNVIHSSRALYVGEIAQMSRSDVVAMRSAGRKTAEEISNVLAGMGLRLGMRIPDWSREMAHSLQRAFQSDLVNESRERDRVLLAQIGAEPEVIEEELVRIASALDTERNTNILIKLWGWSGAPPRTLESVGDEVGLTRERVRQIEASALKRLRTHQFETPHLKAAIGVLRRGVPDVSQALAVRLREEGLSKGPFSPFSLQVAAEHLNVKWPFASFGVGSSKALALKEDEPQFRKAPATLRRKTSERGCVNIFALAADLRVPDVGVAGLARILEAGCKVRWLDSDREWLYASETPRNRLANHCSKVLSVAPKVQLSELRRAVSKSRRLAMCPPLRILAPFIVEMGLADVSDGLVTAIPGINGPLDHDSAEGLMVRVLDQYGPVLDGEVFATRCIDAGMNATTFYIYRLVSPVVSSLGRNVYSKVGAYVPPGSVENIIAERRSSPLATDHGWTPNGKLWFGLELSRLSILSGSIKLNSFVKELVQGQWQVLLPDDTKLGSVNCKDVFIWTFRKVFAVLGPEPGDLAVFEFNLKARTVLVRVGGPGLFEAMQDPESASAESDGEPETAEEFMQ